MRKGKMWGALVLALGLLMLFVPCRAKAEEEDASEVPGKVQGVALDNEGYRTLTVTWDEVDGADGYQLLYSTKESLKGGKKKYVRGGSTTEWTLSGLTGKKTYYLEVRAWREPNGKKIFGAYSKVRHKTVQGKPERVTGVTLDNTEYKALTVTWDKVKKADGYQLLYSTKESLEDGKKKYVKGGSTKTWTLTGLTRKTVYYVEVRAYREVDGRKIFGPYSKVRHKTVRGKLIVIDPGHQRKANTGTEPIGPGSSTRKMKVTGGTRGRYTKLPEYQLNLTVSLLLKEELEKRGYDVKMIRTTNDVNITNSERAKKANRWGADAFLRIHANGVDSSSAHGVLTISPTKSNPYPVRKLYSKCYSLSSCILEEVVGTTGAKSQGVWQTDTMTGINWCTVPVTILEMGYMSNPTEDRKLSTASYQKKIVKGIGNGLDRYFGR